MLTVVGFPAVAAAGAWYYEWSCTGRCAPHQLAISGREGPFASRADCEYARDHDGRADEFVSEGNLGGLEFCEEVPTPGGGGGVVVTGGGAPAPKVRMTALELGAAVGPGWSVTGADGMRSSGGATLGVELDAHSGRDGGGGAIQLGLYRTSLESPLMSADPHGFIVMPFSVGLVLSPRVAGGDTWSVRADLGGSVGGLFQLSCADCAGAVFDETVSFGYTLKAGADVYLSRDGGFSLDVLFPRWSVGAATPGDLLLESPTWMIRLALLTRPAR
ncbi:MAG: hypothetical protein IPL61_35910 [Myxococcales bacterium]|nr:hypothetical protein [Myxococcales bacterium]